MVLEGTLHRLELVQSSSYVKDAVAPDNVLRLHRALDAKIDCALFLGPIANARSLVGSASNIISARLTVRKQDAYGTALINKTITGPFGPLTYPDWTAGLSQHFHFDLSAIDTNQALPATRPLAIYFSVTITTATRTFVAGSGFGEIVESGVVGVTTPLPPTLPATAVSGSLAVDGSVTATGPISTESILSGKVWDLGGQFYNVLAYDIVGDGATDNTAALQALVTLVMAMSGGIIFFPPGNYLVTGIVVENDNVSFMGVGHSSCIRNTHASNTTIQLGSLSGGSNFSQIRNLRFQPTITRSSDAYEIHSHSANDIKFDSLTFIEVWGGMKLGRTDAQYGGAVVSGINGTDFHQLLYTTRFHDGQFKDFRLGAVQNDANHIIVEGGCDALTFNSIEMTNGGAINFWIRAADCPIVPRFIRLYSSFLDGADVAFRQDTGDFNTVNGCLIDNGVVINGGANTRFASCEVYNPASHAVKIFSGAFISFTDFIVRGCPGDGIQILNGYTGGCTIIGGKFDSCSGSGVFIGSGVENVVVSIETIFIDNATDVTNNSTSPTVRLPDKYLKWRSLDLSVGNWTNIGAPYFNAQYGVRHDGRIELRGTIHNGTFTYPYVFAALPSPTDPTPTLGWVPASNITRTVEFGSGVGVISVGADGKLRIWNPGPSNSALTLDGISFLPA